MKTNDAPIASRVHAIVLISFAAMLGTFEGPAEIACALAVITSVLIARKKNALWQPRLALIVGLLAIWALAGIPGVLGTEARVSSEDKLRPLLALGFFVGAFGLRLADERLLGKIALAFGIAIVINGAYGFLQLGFGDLPLDHLLLKNRQSPQVWAPNHVFNPASLHPSGVRAVSGLFYNRLKLAHVGLVGVALLALMTLRTNTRPRLRVVAAVGALLLSTSVVLTYARAALGAFLVAAFLLVLLTINRKSALVFAATACAVVGGIALGSDIVRERLARASSDWGLRRQIFSSALRMIAENPVLGVGHGAYKAHAPLYYPRPSSTEWLIDAHNLGLHVVAETGVVGAAAFFGAILVAVATLVARVRERRSSWTGHDVLDRLALFGLIAVGVLGLTHFPLHHAPVALVFWTLLGVAGGGKPADVEE